MPKMKIPRKLLPFLKKKKRFKIALGGRGSAKSMTFADLCLMDAQTHAIKTACFREYQNSIDDSVLALLTAEIERLGLQGFDCQRSKILLGADEVFKFRGLARNPEGVKSMHGFKRFWVEEGQTMSFQSIKALTPTLREEDSEIWISANPLSRADPFSQRFIVPFLKELMADGYYEDDLHLIIWVNYHDNPMFPAVLEQERAHDEKTLSKALYNHIWLGHFYDETENSIIPVDWFDASIDSHLKLGFKPMGAKIVAHDPSDTGPDAKGLAMRHGSVVLDVQENPQGDIHDGSEWAINYAISEGADHYRWDGDGMGVALKKGVAAELNGKKIEFEMFLGSGSVDDPDRVYEPLAHTERKAKKIKDTFKNKRSQYYWALRDRFYKTYRAVEHGEYQDPDEMISLSSDIENMDQLRAELCRIPLKNSGNGFIQIMSKKEMASQSPPIDSPNMGDSVMMLMPPPPVVAKAVELTFKSAWK